uniref:SET domain-containing protein n=1 Tax=Dracunculus medinensis TaxID=318479 RepID=A0A0N4U8A9_DRAME
LIILEDVTEEKGTEEEGDGKVSSISLSGSRSRAENADDEWNEDYTTRCYCGLDHNDDFMIQCDICNVWQHGKCMGVDQRRIPKVYKCEECYPRTLKLTKAQAYELQNKILLQLRHGKNVIQKRNRKNSGTTQKRTKVVSFIKLILYFDYYCFIYDDAYVVELVCSNRDVRSMFVVASCTGLVADRAFSRNEPVMYLSVPNFSNLILNGEEIPICVDARRTGSITRYVRRSCTPNLFLKHVFCGGKLHIIGFAQCSIDRLDELTVPFDSDYQLSILSLTCACASSFEEEDDVEVSLCKIKNFNRKLKMKSLISGEVCSFCLIFLKSLLLFY